MAKRLSGALPAKSQDSRTSVIHVFDLGGTSFIENNALFLQLLSNSDSNVRVEVRMYCADFDADSDAKANAKLVAQCLSRLTKVQREQRDRERTLGAVYNATVARDLVVSSKEYDQCTGQMLLDGVREEERPDAERAAGILLNEDLMNTTMGHGCYASNVLGGLNAAYHRGELHGLVDAAMAFIDEHQECRHAVLVMGSLIGATGLSFLPIILERLAQYRKKQDFQVYALLDGGTFIAHSAAYSLPKYHGSRDVKAKGDAVLGSLHDDGLLDVLDCGVVLTPLHHTGEPYWLCEEMRLEGRQCRHSSIENLLGAQLIMELILGQDQEDVFHAVRNSGQKVFRLQRSPDAPEDRALNFADLGLDGTAFHSVLRKVAAGAAVKHLILSLDDSTIKNIPALHDILDKMSLQQLKAEMTRFADACMILTQNIYDFCMTGSNFQEYPDMRPEDDYCLANTSAIEKVLKGDCNTKFNISEMGSYEEVMEGRRSQVRKHTVNYHAARNRNLKHYVDEISASSVEDFFLQLFRLAR